MPALGTSSPNISSQSISSLPTFQTSAIVPGNPLSVSLPSLCVTTVPDVDGGGTKMVTSAAEVLRCIHLTKNRAIVIVRSLSKLLSFLLVR